MPATTPRRPSPARSRAAAPVLSVLALCLVAAGCGKADTAPEDLTTSGTSAASTQPTEAAVVPKGATVVKGTGYSFAMPQGWTNLTKTVRKTQPSVDVAVGSKLQTKGFTNNLNVVVTKTSGTSPEELKVIADEIKGALSDSAPDYRVQPPTRVAGLTTVHLSGERTAGEQTYWLEQYVVLGEKNAQVVSFSVSLDYPVAKRRQLIESVLKSWSIRA